MNRNPTITTPVGEPVICIDPRDGLKRNGRYRLVTLREDSGGVFVRVVPEADWTAANIRTYEAMCRYYGDWRWNIDEFYAGRFDLLQEDWDE